VGQLKDEKPKRQCAELLLCCGAKEILFRKVHGCADFV
jgi:hypothetical protein